jgi:hypothetical protein
MNIDLLVTMLDPRGRETSSQVPLLIKALYSSSIATHQFGLISAAQIDVGIGDGGIEVVMAARMRGSRGIRKPALARVTIR